MSTTTTHPHPHPHPRRSLDPRDTARALLQTEIERLPPEEREVVERFVARRKVARNISREFPASLTLGQRVADQVARVGGSWSKVQCWYFFAAGGLTTPAMCPDPARVKVTGPPNRRAPR